MKLSERMQIVHDHDGGKPKSLTGWILQAAQLETELEEARNWARWAYNRGRHLESELANLNYIELPNENVSNVFEAYLAWKSKAAQLEAEVKELQGDIKRLSELIDECDGWSGNLGA